MPKVKTHSGAKKRFKKSATGKVKHAKAFRRHHAWAKCAKKVRGMRVAGFLEGQFRKNITKLLPS